MGADSFFSLTSKAGETCAKSELGGGGGGGGGDRSCMQQAFVGPERQRPGQAADRGVASQPQEYNAKKMELWTLKDLVGILFYIILTLHDF